MPWWSKPASARFGGACLIVLAAIAAPLLLATAHGRGIWLDEISSIWLTRHDLPFAQALEQRWLADPHPPLFSAFTWLLRPLYGDDIFLRRLTNAVWIALYAGTAFFMARAYPRTARFFVVFTVLLAGGKLLTAYFPEHRPYSLAIWSSAAALGLFYWVATLDRAIDRRRDAPALALLAAWSVTALNAHYFSTLFVGLTLAALTATLAWRRRWDASAALFASGAIAGAPLLLTLAADIPRMAAVGTDDNWVRTTPREAAHLLASASLTPFVTNLVVAGALLLVIATIARKRPSEARPTPDTVAFAAAAAAAMAISVAVLFAVSLARPILVDRYLVSLMVLAAAAAAALTARLVFSHRWVVAALTANAVVLLAVTNLQALQQTRWADTAGVVSAATRGCADSRVYALDPAFVRARFSAPTQEQVHDWGYEFVGRMYGFNAEVLRPGDGNRIQLSPTCPTVLWGEHIGAARSALSQLSQFSFATDPSVSQALGAARVYLGRHGSTGFVLIATAAH